MRSVNEPGANVPAFLTKLLQLVENPDTNNLISWGQSGRTFIIQNQAEFARDLLPLYYKHNNMASFIRQLNMYGFHKVLSYEAGSMKCEKDEMEFSHPCFMRGRSNLLQLIKRKISNPKVLPVSSDDLKPELMNRVLSDVKQMKGRQESMDARFSVMKQENETLWREVAILRQKHIKQQQIVNNLIQFLMSLVQSSRSNNQNPGLKRKYQLMINNAAHNNDDLLNEQNIKLRRLNEDVSFNNDDLLNEQNIKLRRLNEDVSFSPESAADDMDGGPTIHELADHDLFSEEDEEVDESEMITIEVPAMSPARAVNSSKSDILSPAKPAVVPTAQQEILIENMPNASQDYQTQSTHNQNQDAKQPKKLSGKNITPKPIKIKRSSLNSVFLSNPKPNVQNQTKQNITEGQVTSQPSYSVPIASVLPNKIFAEEEEANASDTDPEAKAAVSALQKVASDYVNCPNGPCTDDHVKAQIENATNYLTAITNGNYGSAVPVELTCSNKVKCNNKKQADKKITDQPVIKTEMENNCQDVMLATVDKGDHRNLPINDVDDHLDSMQSDLDNLRELLRGDSYSLDTNALLGVCNPISPGSLANGDPKLSLSKASLAAKLLPRFTTPDLLHELFGQDDPFYGLSMTNEEQQNLNKQLRGEKEDTNGGESSGQLMWYPQTSQGLDFGDMNLIDDGESLDNISIPLSPLVNESVLNTPHVEMASPSYTL